MTARSTLHACVRTSITSCFLVPLASRSGSELRKVTSGGLFLGWMLMWKRTRCLRRNGAGRVWGVDEENSTSNTMVSVRCSEASFT